MNFYNQRENTVIDRQGLQWGQIVILEELIELIICTELVHRKIYLLYKLYMI